VSDTIRLTVQANLQCMTVESAAPGPRMKSHRSISAGTNLSHAGAASCVVPGTLSRNLDTFCPVDLPTESKLIFSFSSFFSFLFLHHRSFRRQYRRLFNRRERLPVRPA
jgi:hypothetical protein